MFSEVIYDEEQVLQAQPKVLCEKHSSRFSEIYQLKTKHWSAYILKLFFYSWFDDDIKLLRLCTFFSKIHGGGCLVSESCPTLATLWTVARQAALSMGFSRHEYWSGYWLSITCHFFRGSVFTFAYIFGKGPSFCILCKAFLARFLLYSIPGEGGRGRIKGHKC